MNRSWAFAFAAVGGVALLSGSHCGSKGRGFDNDGGDVDSGDPFGDDADINPGNETGTDTGIVVDKCHVPPDTTTGNAPTCMMPAAPPNSFSPKTKWTWDVPANTCQGGFGIEGS